MLPSLHLLPSVKPVESSPSPDVLQVTRFDSVDTRPSGEFLHPYCGSKTCCAASIVGFLFWPALCCFYSDSCKCDQVPLEVENGVLVYSRGEYAGLRYRKGCCE